MHCKDEEFYEPRQAAHQLRDMQLDLLTIRFEPPSTTTTKDWLDNACQKVVVDWILEEAWPFIRGHAVAQAVDIRGYVKQSSRWFFKSRSMDENDRIEGWQQQRLAIGEVRSEIKEYYNELDEEGGGVALNVEEAREKMMKEEQRKLFPLICLCKRECNGKRWSSRD